MLRIAALAIAASLVLVGCGSTAPATDDKPGTSTTDEKKRSSGGAVG